MKKIDWFVARKQLSEDVAEYMRCFIWRKEINLKYAAEIEKAEAAIDNLKVLEGSIHEDNIPQMKTALEARITELTKQRDEEIKAQASFKMSESAKTMASSMRKNPAAADVAIVKFFMTYGLDVSGTGLVDEILNGAGEKIDVKTLVKTEGSSATAFNNANAVKMVYAKAYEHMVYAGTIKAAQIPELVRDKYTSVKEKKAAKK